MKRARLSAWAAAADAAIAAADADIPADTPLRDRRKRISAAYPFGARRWWPYRVWCRRVRAYLARFDNRPLPPLGGLFGERT